MPPVRTRRPLRSKTRKPEKRTVQRVTEFRESRKIGGVERIMGFGSEGVGKSKVWMDVLEGLDVPVFIVDCDESAEASLEDVSEENQEKATVFLADNWDEFRPAVDEAIRRINVYLEEEDPDDKSMYPWLVVEMSDYTWRWVQSWYTDNVFQKKEEDFFIEKRMEVADARRSGNTNEFDGWTDWKYINKEFNSVWTKATRLSRAHLYVIAGEGGLYGDKEEKSNYRPFGAMPAGQKGLRHSFQTILHFGSSVTTKTVNLKSGGKRKKRVEQFLTGTGKERRRNRTRLLDHEVTGRSFVEWYLKEIAGWDSGVGVGEDD